MSEVWSPQRLSLSKTTSPLSSCTSQMSRLSLAERSTLSTSVSETQLKNQTESVYEYIEKGPVFPPNYEIAHQTGASTRFPVYEQKETHALPRYTPTIYKITLVLRKVEWLSPYDPSTMRSWKNLVMELNSTQINFYALENLPVLNFAKTSKSKKHFTFSEIEHDYILNSLKSNPTKYLNPNNLVASYSLQHAKFGIPIDYKKRNCCLRLRLETEQMIIQFLTLDEMIDWANFISTGVNVSLDLDSREMPTDRIVPRRRRNRPNRNRSYSDSELIRRELADYPNTQMRRRASSGEQSFKSKFTRLFGRKNSSIKSNNASMEIEETIRQCQNVIQFEANHSRQMSQVSNDSEIEELSSTRDIATIREQEEEDVDAGDEIPDNEIHSIEQLHDDSDDEDDNTTQLHNENTQNLFNAFSFSNSNSNSYDSDCDVDSDIKWTPSKKTLSRRKYLKDSLRCIKLLPNDECWVGKSVVKAVNLMPFKSKTPPSQFVKEFVVGPHGLIHAR